uniref:hypothetical protein n=1 Tax=uncultured Agrococcus sp. TaxID=382258 RepID=UPI0025E66B1E
DEPEPQPEAPQETAPPSSESTDEPSDDVSEAGPIAFAQIEDAWPEVLSALEGKSRRAWMVASAIRPVDFDADSNKIGLTFRSPGDMNEFRSGRDGDEAIWKIIRSALEQRFGQQFGFAPREGAAPRQSETGAAAATGSGAQETVPEPSPPDHFDDEPPEPEPPYEPSMRESAPSVSTPQPAAAPSVAPTSSGGGWAVAEIPQSEPDMDTDAVIDPWAESATPNATVTVDERHDSKAAASKLPAAMRDAPPPQEPQELSATESARYGEAVIREELGAEFLEELTDEGGR